VLPAAFTHRKYTAAAISTVSGGGYLKRGAGLTGVSDSKLVTGSMWLNKEGADGVAEEIIGGSDALNGGSGNAVFRFLKSSGQRWQITAENSAGTIILSVVTAGVATAASGWHHILFSFDLSDTGKRHLYRNDTSDLTVSTYTNDTMDFTVADWSVAAFPSGASKFVGEIADLALWPGVYMDLSVLANRRKFISGAGKPVNLGPLGTYPGLGQPALFFQGPASTFPTNKGAGGGMTLTGTLADTTSPS
jgi:hypothetical protein